MILLTTEESKLHCKQKVSYVFKKGFSIDEGNKKYHKFRDHYHYTGVLHIVELLIIFVI